jgi:beta-galactosidase/beta-glucuronidase
VAVGAAAVEHLQTRVYYDGAYPTAPLTDASAGPWRVVARVHLLAPAAASGTVQVSGAWSGASASAPATLVAGNNTVELTLTVPAGAVRLWWPNELGEQVRYNVTATWTPAAGPSLSTYRAIGFRYFVLVTGNDTDPSTLAGKDGSDSFTMRFKINGANIWSRGANLIPMDEMEGRLSVDAHVAMLRSAAAAHFNTLRVWGGGSYYNDVVYDTADELGLMMYHDTMYGEVRALSRASAFSRRMPPSRHVPAPLLLFAALVWRQQRRPHAKRHARRRDALPAAPFVSPPEHRHARRVQRVLRQRLVVLLCAADNCGRRPVAAAVARVPVCGL